MDIVLDVLFKKSPVATWKFKMAAIFQDGRLSEWLNTICDIKSIKLLDFNCLCVKLYVFNHVEWQSVVQKAI